MRGETRARPVDVAVIVVTYNSERHIAECLQSVFAQRETISQEIIVVDNQSTDDTVSIVRDRFPAVKLVIAGRNLGFAAGANLGVRHANADYLLLLNPDTVVLDHAIDVLVRFARSNSEYAMYGGRTFKSDGSLEPSSCWGLPTVWSAATFAFGLNLLARRNRFLDPESLGTWPRDTVRVVGMVTGCLLLVARDAWAALGGMDERYFLYGEDADFSMRAHRRGYRPVVCPDARVVHEVGQSSATPTHKLMLLYRGKACFYRTHYRGLPLRLALLFLTIGVGLRSLLTRFDRSGTPERANDWPALWQARREWLPGYSGQSAESFRNGAPVVERRPAMGTRSLHSNGEETL